MANITIKGRQYEVETIPEKENDRSVYLITGKRGNQWYTMRNVPNPDLLFLIPAGGGALSTMKDVWLTDKDGTLVQI